MDFLGWELVWRHTRWKEKAQREGGKWKQGSGELTRGRGRKQSPRRAPRSPDPERAFPLARGEFALGVRLGWLMGHIKL